MVKDLNRLCLVDHHRMSQLPRNLGKVGAGQAAKFKFWAEPEGLWAGPSRAFYELFLCCTNEPTSRAFFEPSQEFHIVTSQIVNLRAKRSPSRARAELFGIFSYRCNEPSRAELGSVSPLLAGLLQFPHLFGPLLPLHTKEGVGLFELSPKRPSTHIERRNPISTLCV